MTNLPERQSATLATLDGQAALFEDSNQLLALTDAQLRHLAAVVGENAESGLAQMRRRFGLLAWAGWLRFEGKLYEEYIAALARYVGVNPRTVKSWRDSVVEKDTLAVPPATDQRKREATEREEKGRSTRVRAGKQHGTKPIPVDSTETAGPSSGGAEVQRPPAPTEEHPSSSSAPPDPHVDDTTDVHVDVDAIGLRWLQSKNDRQVRALADPLGGAIRAEVKRWATAFGYAPGAPPAPAEKPQRRQGTITRPSGEPKRQGWADRSRIITTIPTIPAPKLAKRHADDCRCLSCVPPKAVAK